MCCDENGLITFSNYDKHHLGAILKTVNDALSYVNFNFFLDLSSNILHLKFNSKSGHDNVHTILQYSNFIGNTYKSQFNLTVWIVYVELETPTIMPHTKLER